MKKRNRNPGRPFQKGASGNPGGRPKTPPDVRSALSAQTLPSIQFLADTRDNPKAPRQLRAWCADRLLLKTVPNAEKLELTGEGGGPIRVEAARQRLAEKLTAKLLERRTVDATADLPKLPGGS